MDYEDFEGATVLPDADEAANHTTDDDIVEIGVCPSAVQTSSPAGVNDDEITNTQETTDKGIKGKKSSGPRHGTVSYNPVILAASRVSKSASDHISCPSGSEDHTGSVAHGGEYLDSPWMLYLEC